MPGTSGDDTGVDPAAIAHRLHDRTARTKRREVATATARLDGDYEDELQVLGERLAGRLLAGPLSALAVAAQRDDPALARDVATLFGVERDASAVETTGTAFQKRTSSVEQ